MGDGETAARAQSFGAVAAAYAEHRPGYPRAAVDWAWEPVSGRPRPRVLDLGAGTGKLIGSLPADADVTAVEPDVAMLDELRVRFPAVRAMEGSAEAIPLPDASVDAVLVGQAWHWFALDRALPEIVRVLLPGGVLAVVRNDEDPDAPLMDAFLGADAFSAREVGHHHGLVPPTHDALGPVSRRRFANPHRTDVESTIARLGTFSWMLAAEPADRAAFEHRVRAYLAARPEVSSGGFTLSLVTTVLRALRR